MALLTMPLRHRFARVWVTFTLVWLAWGSLYQPWRASGGAYIVGCAEPEDVMVGTHTRFKEYRASLDPDSFMANPHPFCEHYAERANDRLGYFFWEMARTLSSGELIPVLCVPLGVLIALLLGRWVTSAEDDPNVDRKLAGHLSTRLLMLAAVTAGSYSLWQLAQNGRYTLHFEGGHVYILDTRTGALTYRTGRGPAGISVVIHNDTGAVEIRRQK